MYSKTDYWATEFLSLYTAHKLQNGGLPVITAHELTATANSLINSIYRHSPHTQQLAFDDLLWLAAAWQDRADAQHPHGELGFQLKDGNLVPTYAFRNLSDGKAKTLNAFFDRAPLLVVPSAPTPRRHVSPAVRLTAAAVGRYLTDYFAQKYITFERVNGRWPCHLTDLSNLYRDDLARRLGLAGDKKYFARFRQAASAYVAQLMAGAPDGVVQLTDQVSGTLAFNNLRRLLVDFALLDNLCTSTVDVLHPQQLQLSLHPTAISVTEKTLLNKRVITHHRALTPTQLAEYVVTNVNQPSKRRHLKLGDGLHALRNAVNLFTAERDK